MITAIVKDARRWCTGCDVDTDLSLTHEKWKHLTGQERLEAVILEARSRKRILVEMNDSQVYLCLDCARRLRDEVDAALRRADR